MSVQHFLVCCFFMPRHQGGFSTRQTKDLRHAFDLFDRDKNGAISLAELKQVLIALNFNPTESLLGKVMKQMDSDRNGSVDFDEFARAMSSIYEQKFTEEEMQRAFKCFDADHSGYITVDELRKVLSRLNQNLSERRISEVLREIDADHDGKISYDEFVHMLEEV